MQSPHTRRKKNSLHTHLDKLVCHFGRHVHTPFVEIPRLCVSSLSGQYICPLQILVSFALAIGFCAPFGRERTAIEDNIGTYSVVAEEPDTVHGVVDISFYVGGDFGFEVLP